MPKAKPGESLVILVDEMEVASWSPDPVPGRTPPTQVHLILTTAHPGEPHIVVRIKSARACDELIAVLKEHREDVWGEAPEDLP